MFDQAQARPVLGPVSLNTSIKSARGPFKTVPQVTVYPKQVVHALIGLYAEYNKAFVSMVAHNREFGRKYEYPYCGTADKPKNWFVQIDMLGLSDDLLAQLSAVDFLEARRILRRRIFEIENSVAMYALLQDLFPEAPFKQRFRGCLDTLRASLGTQGVPKRIALLAVTPQKYDAMLADEFGLPPGVKVSDEEVYRRTGFDCMMGPDEFLAHLQENGGTCTVALYVRSSDPIDKQRDPRASVEHPLLSDRNLRQIIRQNAVTISVDNPAWAVGDRSCVTDSKAYLHPMGMGFPVRSLESIFPVSFVEHVAMSGRVPPEGDRFQADFAQFLIKFGIDPALVADGSLELRAKPMQGTYGCHGHFSGRANSPGFIERLERSIRERGPYVVQPELVQPTAVVDGAPHHFIDRVFLAGTSNQPIFLGGFRSYMPIKSIEGKKNNNHGNENVVWGQIGSAEPAPAAP